MAENPEVTLNFIDDNCADCGYRSVALPEALPDVGDDFDWLVRDFDGYKMFIMEELAARFPERKRWTPADVEVALVEVLSTILDQLSDMLDRTQSEAFLETARRPQSVRALLKMIGYDALEQAKLNQQGPYDPNAKYALDDPRTEQQKFDQFWLDNPTVMEEARLDGPRKILTQKRMVTLQDYQNRFEEHPLILRARAWEEWSGSWPIIYVALIPWNNQELDDDILLENLPQSIQAEVINYHDSLGIQLPTDDEPTSIRTVLRYFIEAYRMLGQEIILRDAISVGIQMAISIQVNKNYFQSEVRHAVEEALGTEAGGFFEPGRLRFGQDLYAGDIFQTLMSLDGVDNVCLNRFKRLGNRYNDQSDEAVIVLSGLEVAVCDNGTDHNRGYFHLKLNGGRKG